MDVQTTIAAKVAKVVRRVIVVGPVLEQIAGRTRAVALLRYIGCGFVAGSCRIEISTNQVSNSHSACPENRSPASDVGILFQQARRENDAGILFLTNFA